MAITDLTNTTWHISAGWIATAGLIKANITGSVTCEYVATYPIDLNTDIGNTYTFGIGYGMRDMADANRIRLNTSGYGDPYQASIVNTEEFDITITGGVDATNNILISWLEANGELQGADTDSVGATVSYKDTIISVNSNETVILQTNGKLLTEDILVTSTHVAKVVEWDGSHTISGGVELISFAIGIDAYNAEVGMTWEQWVDSSYNTGRFVLTGLTVRNSEGLAVYAGGSSITATDTINNGWFYTLKSQSTND